jgi:hypothetical protein
MPHPPHTWYILLQGCRACHALVCWRVWGKGWLLGVLLSLSFSLRRVPLQRKHLYSRYTLSHLNITPCTSHLASLYRMPLCHTVSKAQVKSQNIATMTPLLFRMSRTAVVSLATWSTADMQDWKPPWLGRNAFLRSRKRSGVCISRILAAYQRMKAVKIGR